MSELCDCHCHLLPAIDDGAKSYEMALEMARSAMDAGVKRIICTPHHLNSVFENPRKAILRHVAGLRTQLAEADISVTLYSGSELHLVPELPAKIEEGEALTYNDRGKAALVELPKSTLAMGTETLLEQLLYRKITPIIAHPERNAVLAAHPERVGEWVSWGCKLQLTAQSCSGDFGEPIQQVCQYWCERGWVHLIASDAHRPHGRSPRKLAIGRDTVAEWLGDNTAELLSVGNPQRLIDGDALENPQPITTDDAKSTRLGKPWWRRFLG